MLSILFICQGDWPNFLPNSVMRAMLISTIDLHHCYTAVSGLGLGLGLHISGKQILCFALLFLFWIHASHVWIYNNNNNRIHRRYSRFFTISSQRRELSPTRTFKWPAHVQHIDHVQHIERLSRASVMLRATWYEGTAQLVSLTELKSHLFELYFIGWTIKPMKEGRKPEYPEKTPGDELQKMPHSPARRFKPRARLEPVQ